MLRLIRRLVVLATVLAGALVLAAPAQPSLTFAIKGRGWGHGIGMSQYGAQGFATKDNRDYRWILSHYYPGTTLDARPSTMMKVLVSPGRSAVRIGSITQFTPVGAKDVAAGTWRATATASGKLKLVMGGSTRMFASQKTFAPGGGFLEVNGAPYRGTVVLRVSGSRVFALNRLSIDNYVRGVIAREMPSSWAQPALRAQAVAARSYALAGGGKCSFPGTGAVFCPDTRDQVYGGVGAETPSTNAAVAGTAGEVLVSNGSVASTFFFSTSGGKTASVSDEWGSSQSAFPYLRSVSDPFDSISPHHRWGPTDAEDDCPNGGRDCVWRGSAMRRALGLGALGDLTTSRNSSSRVAEVHVSPGTVDFTGADFRSRLGLRSTWFTIGVLRLTGGTTVGKGQKVTLAALVRNVGSATLQRKRAGESAWTNVRSVNGSANVAVRPQVTTFFRLSSPSAATAAVRVRVRATNRAVV
jgi:stage II sporulation protein D